MSCSLPLSRIAQSQLKTASCWLQVYTCTEVAPTVQEWDPSSTGKRPSESTSEIRVNYFALKSPKCSKDFRKSFEISVWKHMEIENLSKPCGGFSSLKCLYRRCKLQRVSQEWPKTIQLKFTLCVFMEHSF